MYINDPEIGEYFEVNPVNRSGTPIAENIPQTRKSITRILEDVKQQNISISDNTFHMLSSLMVRVCYDDATEILYQMFKNENINWSFRIYIMQYYAGIGRTKHLSEIKNLVSSEIGIVAQAAAKACVVFRDRSCIPLIEKRIEFSERAFSKNKDTRHIKYTNHTKTLLKHYLKLLREGYVEKHRCKRG